MTRDGQGGRPEPVDRAMLAPESQASPAGTGSAERGLSPPLMRQTLNYAPGVIPAQGLNGAPGTGGSTNDASPD